MCPLTWKARSRFDFFDHFARMKTTKNKDFAYAMTPFKILSWPMGTWPLQAYDMFSFIRFVLAIVMLLLMVVTLNSEIYLDRSNAEVNLDVLLLSVCGILAVSKVTCYRVYSSSLIVNFTSAKKDYNELNDEEKRTIMKRHAFMGRVACVSVILLSNLCSLIFSMLPMLTKNEQEFNATVEDIIKYPIPSEHIITKLKLPDNFYWLVFFMESWMLLTLSTGNTGSDSLFFGIILHLCGQVEILKMDFSRLAKNQKNDRTAENFHSLIKRHEYLLKLGEMLNETVSTILIAQLLTSCILICTCGFQFIIALHDENIAIMAKTFTILITLLIQLFAYSYVGDYLKCQMDDIGFSLYDCSWYYLPTSVARDLTFVILKAQEPVYLTAGKFFVVNLETYMSILKTSMSYLSVLRVMINA